MVHKNLVDVLQGHPKKLEKRLFWGLLGRLRVEWRMQVPSQVPHPKATTTRPRRFGDLNSPMRLLDLLPAHFH